ncbi:LysR family transcriptional regulator [Methylovirgula sp. 4M-Z18]|uniref:LysR family transcriptional regulator n=1 Tax=Methylovirgula sp. 4M-Z18 TaxID=2293567 RepID=UPI000E2F5E92|nr:LysR family transcriptional regulator [Methylovirgula sp. 4M-Z18]RFB79642.1 LysR family transcriptional regulator [Methylovirgula sp. 4M-Z18]
MDALSLDQFLVFVTIADEGSFAAAARRLNRAQSAITYAIQKLEDQSGLILFDRSQYRPTLTEAGATLLPRARRVLDDVADYRLQASGIAKGLEAELTLLATAYFPGELLARVLRAFNAAFPAVQIRLSIESTDTSTDALRDRQADLALINEFTPLDGAFERRFCTRVGLVAVAAPGHPLAHLPASFGSDLLQDHTQIVLEARSETRDGRDFGVHAANRWRVTDLDMKHQLLLGGVGWGSMPYPRVAADLAAGRLVALKPDRWEGSDRMPVFPLVIAHLKETPLGPAARWLVQKFVEESAAETANG